MHAWQFGYVDDDALRERATPLLALTHEQVCS